MKLEDTFTINAPLETVWDFLLDIPRVSVCTPGVENVQQIGPDVYDGLLKVKVGPVSAAFSGQVTIVESLPTERMVARIEGKDKATASIVNATFSADLKPVGNDTLISYSMDVTLRGRLAQFGVAVVQGTAKKMTVEFANCLQDALSPTRRIAILGTGFTDPQIESQELAEFDVEFIIGSPNTPEELFSQAGKAFLILAGQGVRFSREVLQKLPNCRAIIRYGSGAEGIDLRAATQQNIMVADVPDYCTEEVATHTMALILACGRKLLPAHQAAVAGNWQFDHLGPLSSTEYQVLGILGSGEVAQAVLRKARPFGFEILVHDPQAQPEKIVAAGAKAVSLSELVARSDILSLHVPIDSKTYHMIGADLLHQMKPTAYLINTSDGQIVDEVALEKALAEGWIAGAALDVMDYEPVDAGRSILKSERLLVTPHMAGYTEQSYERLRRMASREAMLVLRGEQPVNLLKLDVVEAKHHSRPSLTPLKWSE